MRREKYDIPNSQVLAVIPEGYRPAREMYRVPAVLRKDANGDMAPCMVNITSITGEIIIDSSCDTAGYDALCLNVTYVCG